LRYLRIYSRNESDKSQSQRGYTGDSPRKICILEENQKSYETKDPKRYEDLNKVGPRILV
jgi:hypothetical protein